MNQRPFETVEPVHLEWKPDGSVGIVWDDAHESVYPVVLLREQCPCATCKGTHGPPTTLVVRQSRGGLPIVSGGAAKRVEPSLEVKSVDPVGRYAMRFTWGDGHNSGIYSYRYLRSICPCPACSALTTTASAQV
jgi:DUF971 family protein